MSVMNPMPESSKLIAIGKAKEIYMEEMKKKCGANTPSMPSGIFLEEHERCMDKAMGSFDELKKYGDTDLVEKFRAKLAKEIEAKRVEYERANEGKRREEENARQAEVLIHLARIEMFSVLKLYAKTLPKPNCEGEIVLNEGLRYAPALETFIRHGGIFYRGLHTSDITPDTDFSGPGFTHYPHNFLDNLITYCYDTEKPEEIIGTLVFAFASTNLAPAPFPAQMKPGAVPALCEQTDCAPPYSAYTMGNKHKPEVEFRMRIHFYGDAKYKKMGKFRLETHV